MSLIRPEDWTPQGVNDLEDRAWEALRETARSVCVTAGAGAGKTEFLAQKATYLLQTGLCPYPKRILAISFKRDAARNLADRVTARCPPQQARRFVSMTFDAFTKHLLDQFRNAIPADHRPPPDYEVAIPTRDQLADFLRRIGVNNVATDRLEKAVSRTALPLDEQDISERQREILEAYWTDQYEGADSTYLTFAMINRLVDLMIRRNPRIRSALRSTYPFVFLDEFQDTTYPQFDLAVNVFDPNTTVCTAVGDDKQKIMVWAGAMSNAFEEFTNRFNARCISLLSNWRSHEDLVAIQHVIARRIDPDVEMVVARKPRLIGGDVAAIWEFQDRDAEIQSLAAWIASEIALGEVQPHDIAVLVRMYADRVEDELAPALAEHGVILRNVARNVGTIAIQDLLAEDLTGILLPFLRLGATRRNAKAWGAAQNAMRTLEAIQDDDEISQQRMTKRLEGVARTIRTHMREHDPDEEEAAALVPLLLEQIGEQLIRQANPAYSRDLDFQRVRDGLILLLQESAVGGGTWVEVLDRFEGLDQVPMMTIHKSKGLEFHTMIFFGLDTRSWWSLRPDADEELKSFFVAFTRAEQRAFFTCCQARGGRIDWLEDLLGEAVPRVALA